MLMAMEPIWESDFHSGSYGFRPERSVHHAVRTVRMQLQDGSDSKGRWIIEGDLASYFDTVHHRLLLKYVRRRITDLWVVELLSRFLKYGHVDVDCSAQPVKAFRKAAFCRRSCPTSCSMSLIAGWRRNT